ncbi:ABC transporter ATP-binding protein [Dongia sp.]|uniref:ABC transporter ATP-binding protein n=1 Tax=Dongia sp. TaxID=1977262 RepID=UPI0037513861
MTALLKVEQLVTRFAGPKPGTYFHACDGIDLEVRQGEILGLVGESGCGKSTLGRSIIGLEKPASGRVIFNGVDLATLRGAMLRKTRRRIQYIFQDAYASLNPRQTIGQTLDETLIISGERSDAARSRAIEGLLDNVGLAGEIAQRFPRELSGGQRQRVSIARALVMKPELLICDEPVSALDLSVRAQVMNLIIKLRETMGMACIFIAHDLALVRQAAQRTMVMYLGKIVELAPSDELYATPGHPYTKALLSAIPDPDPRIESTREPILLSRELPSPLDPPSGCRFHTRCWMQTETCTASAPSLDAVGKPGHLSACHYRDQVLQQAGAR